MLIGGYLAERNEEGKSYSHFPLANFRLLKSFEIPLIIEIGSSAYMNGCYQACQTSSNFRLTLSLVRDEASWATWTASATSMLHKRQDKN